MTTPLTIEPKTRTLHQGSRDRINHEALLTGFACLTALSIALLGLMGQASPLEMAPAVSWSVCALAILCALWLIHDRLDGGVVAGPLAGRSPSVVLDDVADVVMTVNCDLTVQRVRGTALPADLVLELLDPKDISGAHCALSRCIAGEPSRFTARLRYPDDRVVDFRAVPVTVAQGPVSLKLFGWDITSWRRREDALIRRQMELERVNRQLVVDVNTDALTGLANRRHLLAAGSRILKEAVDQRHTVSCVYLDLDHFKSVNDTFGHDAGDQVLAEFAEVLRAHVRQDDVVARIGGEEFVFLLPCVPPHRAAEVVWRICCVVSFYYFFALPMGDHITVSIGVVL
jgi:diguanylate cyclase (GGDEF)-like protein